MTGQPTLRDLTHILDSVKSKWHALGIQLGVDMAKLQSIESRYSDPGRCLSEMLGVWLKGKTDVPVTLKSVVKALKSSPVNEQILANYVEHGD